MEKEFVETSPFAPATCTIKLFVTIALGVPLIVPSLLKAKPGGKLPDTIDHEYGIVLPLALKV
jgi:hypothetical protein